MSSDIITQHPCRSVMTWRFEQLRSNQLSSGLTTRPIYQQIFFMDILTLRRSMYTSTRQASRTSQGLVQTLCAMTATAMTSLLRMTRSSDDITTTHDVEQAPRVHFVALTPQQHACYKWRSEKGFTGQLRYELHGG